MHTSDVSGLATLRTGGGDGVVVVGRIAMGFMTATAEVVAVALSVSTAMAVSLSLPLRNTNAADIPRSRTNAANRPHTDAAPSPLNSSLFITNRSLRALIWPPPSIVKRRSTTEHEPTTTPLLTNGTINIAKKTVHTTVFTDDVDPS